MESKKNLAVLCDYGLDDAIATLYLLNYSYMFGQIDILPIAGNFSLEKAYINAKRLITYNENMPANLRIVDTSCVLQNEESVSEIHGRDGIGDILPEAVEETAEVIGYEKWIKEIDDSYVILSLGPCTVTRDILNKKGSLPLVMMGGNIAQPPNYNGYEFNHGMDTGAFAECVKYPHLVATLDTCHCHQCDINHAELSDHNLLGKMLIRYRELSRDRKEAECYVYDLVAADYVVHPERFSSETAQDKDGNTLSVLKYISEKPII